eukprot:CAMPEP_0176066782 /NCGR_PEP_ID=MMETSP0120_2-20121206/33329_1 /TAXON_ID=160619 /ORGANISM="Kryptoperidinium foliaceum, Strain CCMP 1326" /LENGTH=154 /DNA_ID=CAMNT_0017400391 /DNA_START=191 /DNA_END=652 /DNA_ORIENTATION=+
MGRNRGNRRAAAMARLGTTLLDAISPGRPFSARHNSNIGLATSPHQLSATAFMHEFKGERRSVRANAGHPEQTLEPEPMPRLKNAILSMRTASACWHKRGIQSKLLDVAGSLFAVAVYTILSPSSSSANKKVPCARGAELEAKWRQGRRPHPQR